MILKINNKINSLQDLKNLASTLSKELENKKMISLCSGTGCKAYSSDDVYIALMDELNKSAKSSVGKRKNIVIKRTGCPGFCERGPVIVIYPDETCYLNVKKEDANEIIEKTANNEIVERLLFRDSEGNIAVKESDIPFYKYQKRIILGSNSKIDPTSIVDYIRIGGYQALAKALLEMTSYG